MNSSQISWQPVDVAEKRTMASQLEARIRQDIINGQLAPGSRLRLKELADAVRAAGAHETADHDAARDDRHAGGILVGEHGEVGAAHADRGDRGVEAEILARQLDRGTGPAAGHAAEQVELDAGIGGIACVYMV